MLVLGNWKLNGSLALVRHFVPALAQQLAELDPARVTVGVCPPSPYLPACAEARQSADAVQRLALGAQDVSARGEGAYTGEVAATMVRELGARYALVGHSERRQYHGETDALIGQKARAALTAGLVPVLCLGESLAEREAGRAEAVVLRQLDTALAEFELEGADELVVAYEPVWAIGTGQVASPLEAQTMHAALRARLREVLADFGADVPLLYGGSVNPDNAAALFGQADIDGALVGGASLKVADFATICQAAAAV